MEPPRGQGFDNATMTSTGGTQTHMSPDGLFYGHQLPQVIFLPVCFNGRYAEVDTVTPISRQITTLTLLEQSYRLGEVAGVGIRIFVG